MRQRFCRIDAPTRHIAGVAEGRMVLVIRRAGRTHLTYFHSRKMRHSKGEFKDWTIDQKKTFMANAAKVGLKHRELASLSYQPTAAPQAGRHQIGTPDGFGLEHVVSFRLECMVGLVGVRNNGEPIFIGETLEPF